MLTGIKDSRKITFRTRAPLCPHTSSYRRHRNCFVARGSNARGRNDRTIFRSRKESFSLNFIFLESILKSGVSFVTILSIFSMKLSGLYLLLALYIETYAAFIYPIVEMGKYLRGKELK